MTQGIVSAVTSLTAGGSDRIVAATLLRSALDATGATRGGVRLDRGVEPGWETSEVEPDYIDRLYRHLDFQYGEGRPVRAIQGDAVINSFGGPGRPASVIRGSAKLSPGHRLDIVLLDSCRVEGFSIDDQSSVEAFVAVAALAMSNREQSVSRRRFEEWMAVIEDTSTLLLRGVAPRLVLDGVLDSIARDALNATGAEMAGVATPDATGRSMMFRVAVGEGREHLVSTPFPEERSLSGLVKQTGEPILVADAVLDKRSYGPIVQHLRLGPTAVGPLWLNQRAIGVVFVGNHRHGAELDPERAIKAVTEADLAEHLQVVGVGSPPDASFDSAGSLSISRRLASFDEENDGWNRLISLDEREIDLLMMVAEGFTNGEIAVRLGLAEKTIRNSMTVLWSHLGVKNRVQAAVLVARHVERLGRLGAFQR